MDYFFHRLIFIHNLDDFFARNFDLFFNYAVFIHNLLRSWNFHFLLDDFLYNFLWSWYFLVPCHHSSWSRNFNNFFHDFYAFFARNLNLDFFNAHFLARRGRGRKCFTNNRTSNESKCNLTQIIHNESKLTTSSSRRCRWQRIRTTRSAFSSEIVWTVVKTHNPISILVILQSRLLKQLFPLRPFLSQINTHWIIQLHLFWHNTFHGQSIF